MDDLDLRYPLNFSVILPTYDLDDLRDRIVPGMNILSALIQGFQVVDPLFDLMIEFITGFQSLYETCVKICAQTEDVDEIQRCKREVTLLLKDRCLSIYDGVREKLNAVPEASVVNEAYVFLNIVKFISMTVLARLINERADEEETRRKEEALKNAIVAARLVEERLDELPEVTWLTLLFSYTKSFAQHQVKEDTNEGILTLMMGMRIHVPENLNWEGRKCCERMKRLMVQCLTKWEPTMVNMIIQQKTVERIDPRKVSLLVFAHILLFTFLLVFKESELYKTHIAEHIHRRISDRGVLLGVVFSLFFLHALISTYFMLEKRDVPRFTNGLKAINIFVGTGFFFGSVLVGYMFQDVNLKDVPLMGASVLFSFYALLLSRACTRGFDAGLPEVSAGFALYLGCFCLPVKDWFWFWIVGVYCALLFRDKYRSLIH